MTSSSVQFRFGMTGFRCSRGTNQCAIHRPLGGRLHGMPARWVALLQRVHKQACRLDVEGLGLGVLHQAWLNSAPPDCAAAARYEKQPADTRFPPTARPPTRRPVPGRVGRHRAGPLRLQRRRLRVGAALQRKRRQQLPRDTAIHLRRAARAFAGPRPRLRTRGGPAPLEGGSAPSRRDIRLRAPCVKAMVLDSLRSRPSPRILHPVSHIPSLLAGALGWSYVPADTSSLAKSVRNNPTVIALDATAWQGFAAGW